MHTYIRTFKHLIQDLRCCRRGVLSLYLSLNFGICWFDVSFYVDYVFNLLNLLECDRKLWNVFANLVFNFVIRFRVVRLMVLWAIRPSRSRIWCAIASMVDLPVHFGHVLACCWSNSEDKERERKDFLSFNFFFSWNVLDR